MEKNWFPYGCTTLILFPPAPVPAQAAANFQLVQGPQSFQEPQPVGNNYSHNIKNLISKLSKNNLSKPSKNSLKNNHSLNKTHHLLPKTKNFR
uniref:Uncharacterized protein n=2 Tax=Meloidogyne TaxID=189290 RepID=A0A6V7VLT1_MELEN|nr:unnamed protein product [Meloidogyne enterolobii]